MNLDFLVPSGGKASIHAVKAYSYDRSGNPSWGFINANIDKIPTDLTFQIVRFTSVISPQVICGLFTFQHINPYFKLSAAVDLFAKIGTGEFKKYVAGEQILYVLDTADTSCIAYEA